MRSRRSRFGRSPEDAAGTAAYSLSCLMKTHTEQNARHGGRASNEKVKIVPFQ